MPTRNAKPVLANVCIFSGSGNVRETDIDLTGGGNGHPTFFSSETTKHFIHSEKLVEQIAVLVEKIQATLGAAKPAMEAQGSQYALA